MTSRSSQPAHRPQNGRSRRTGRHGLCYDFAGMLETPSRTQCELLPRPRGIRRKCQACGGDLQRARQIDDTMMVFCENGCRDDHTGLPILAERNVYAAAPVDKVA